jgi:sterol desaturase/sphingolipid hydroxylase (fatty acid hydroxylase superfamily)/rhodanese-related sulfurtransferase
MQRVNPYQALGLASLALFLATGLTALIRSRPDLEAVRADIRKEFPKLPRIQPHELAEWLADARRTPPQILDVRTGPEYAVSHLPGARWIHPSMRARETLDSMNTNRGAVLYCTVGYRAARSAGQLLVFGYTNLFLLDGSIFAWANEGRRLERNGRPVQEVHPYNAAQGAMLKPGHRGALQRRFELHLFDLPMIEQLKIASAIGLLVVLLVWESVGPFFCWFRRNGRGRFEHGVRNIAAGGLNVVLVALVFVPAWWLVSNWASATQFGVLNSMGLTGAAHLIGAILLLDCWTYWWHWLNHHVRFLWRFHRMHHSDLHVDVTSASRFHFGELILSSILRIPLIPLFGVEFNELLLYETALFAVVQFHHSNINLAPRLDRWLRLLIVTPDMHRVHHSREMIHADSNFSSMLSIWDRLFRTWQRHPNAAAIQFGIVGFDAGDRHSFPGMMRTPLLPVNERGGD